MSVDYRHTPWGAHGAAIPEPLLMALRRRGRGRPLPEHTLQETATALNMSIDQVRETEQRAFRKLRSQESVRALARRIGIAALLLLLCSSLAIAQTTPTYGANSYTITWSTTTNAPASESNYVASVTAWANALPRLRCDLSLDGGATWPRTLAYGIRPYAATNPPYTNALTISLPDDPALLSTNARVRLQPLRDLGANNASGRGWIDEFNPTNVLSAEGLFVEILGVRIDAPVAGAALTPGAFVPLQWCCAGADEEIRIGITQDTVNPTYQELTTLSSSDLPATNSSMLVFPSVTPGAATMIFQSTTDPKVYRTVAVEVTL